MKITKTRLKEIIKEEIQENFLSSLFGKDKSSRRSKDRVVGNVRNLQKALDDVELTKGATSLPWLPNIPRKHEFEEMIAKDPDLERKIKKRYRAMQNYWNTFSDREKEFSTRSRHGYGASASDSGGDEILFRVQRALTRERDKYEDWEAEVLVRADQVLSRWKSNLDQLKALMG